MTRCSALQQRNRDPSSYESTQFLSNPNALHHHVKLPPMFPFSTSAHSLLAFQRRRSQFFFFVRLGLHCVCLSASSSRRSSTLRRSENLRVQHDLLYTKTRTGRSVAFLLELKETLVAPLENGSTDKGNSGNTGTHLLRHAPLEEGELDQTSLVWQTKQLVHLFATCQAVSHLNLNWTKD